MAQFIALVCLLVWMPGCILDRTGQSRSLGLQQDLASTNTQLQGLQRQVDDQLMSTSAKLVEVEENAQLSRRNLADSGALLDTLLSELQVIRGNLEDLGHRATLAEERGARLQEDTDFRLAELEKRLDALEQLASGLQVEKAVKPEEGDAEGPLESGEALSDEESIAKARSYFESGKYRVSKAFLRGFEKKYPDSELREEAQFLLAESLFKGKEPAEALQQYQVLMDEFPESKRLAQVMLRQGECFVELDSPADARVFLEELIKAFPKSEEAGIARGHLEKLQP